LLRGGLDSELNHNVVRLIACSKYGYSESMKTDMALMATTAKPLTSIEDCDRQIAEAQAQKTLFENMAVEAQQLPSAIVS
jgi:hypothetical protein